jgi:hypothetical protein
MTSAAPIDVDSVKIEEDIYGADIFGGRIKSEVLIFIMIFDCRLHHPLKRKQTGRKG